LLYSRLDYLFFLFLLAVPVARYLTFGAKLGIRLKNCLINPKHLGFHREKEVIRLKRLRVKFTIVIVQKGFAIFLFSPKKNPGLSKPFPL